MNGLEQLEFNQKLGEVRSQPRTPAASIPEPADPAREAMSERVSAYNQQVREIREDPRLSEQGRREALQQAYETAHGTVTKMQADDAQKTETTATELRRALFGLDSNTATLAYRDAQDRVSKVRTPEALGDLMDQADASGDDTLLRAGFAVAYERSTNPLGSDGWDNIVAEYVRTRPKAAANLTALRAATNRHGRTAEMVRRMETSVSKPRELRR